MSSTPPPPVPPLVPARPHLVVAPAGTREDEYYWMRDDTRSSAEVLAALAAENAYADAALAPLAPLREALHQEMIARLKQDDASVPYYRHGFWYYSRYEAGREYPIHARRAGSMSAPEQQLLDVNELAHGHEFFDLGELAVSPDGRLLAWAEDAVGRRQYVIRCKDLATGALLGTRIENAEAGVEWTADSARFLYVEKDPVTLLGFRVRCHRLGTDTRADALVWEQTDDSFYTDVAKTKDERYLLIETRSTLSSECWYADAADPQLRFRVFLPRESEHEYEIESCGERWIVRTNWQAPNFRLVEVSAGEEGRRELWRDLVPHDPEGFLHDFDVFRSFLVLEERSGGLRRLRIRPWAAGAGAGVGADADADADAGEVLLASPDPTCTAGLGTNVEFDSDLVRYVYTSLTTPPTTCDYDARSGRSTVLRREPVLGGFDAGRYQSEHRFAPARDGRCIPVSIVYRRDTPRDGSAPLLQYAYGAYGISQDPLFSSSLVSLLDRGFVYAIAHVRGGQELGRSWYEQGRQLHKMNTFTDFLDVTAWLVESGYADRRRVFARGGSAGGLTVCAAANLAPAAYRGVVAVVPFVDVVTTMLDESIPLTTNEFDEWGDPRDPVAYQSMLAWSPYDNLARAVHPAMYVFTGLWDSQVQYFEPAKYVARARARNQGSRPMIFRIEMGAGHGGRSGRLEHYREIAEQYAFLIWQAGCSA